VIGIRAGNAVITADNAIDVGIDAMGFLGYPVLALPIEEFFQCMIIPALIFRASLSRFV
jgi:hypothetical protein